MRTTDSLPPVGSPELAAVAAAVPIETLESSHAVIYATDPQLRLIYANAAWDLFAVNNAAPHLTRAHLARSPLLEAVRGPLRDFYGDRFAEALRTGKPVEHAFECSSPQLFRTFQMRILPLQNEGLLVMNTLTVEEPMSRTGVTASQEYVDSNRLISMCSHCRRTERPDSGAWDWVPSFVEHQPDQVSHGLCPVCLEYHYLSRKRQSAEFFDIAHNPR